MRRFGHLRAAVAAVAVSAALVAATTIGAGGASASAVARAPQATTGGVIKFAESPGASPNFILPLTTSATQSLYNIYQFINLMWPLIYLPTPNEPTLDYAHSMAYAPVWSDNDTVATVTLKHYMWSDGVPVTARDVVFFYNEVRAMGPHGAATAGQRSSPSTSRPARRQVRPPSSSYLRLRLTRPSSTTTGSTTCTSSRSTPGTRPRLRVRSAITTRPPQALRQSSHS